MIYLLDDKKNRQSDYGWNEEKFSTYSEFIEPIYLYKDINDEHKRRDIFSSDNIILFHESFFDNPLNKHEKDAINIRNNLNKYAKEHFDFKTVYFSGSKNSRKLDQNIAYIPVSVLYQNLEIFIKRVSSGDNDLRYLIFGDNPEIEEYLLKKLEKANNEIEDYIELNKPEKKCFIAQTLQNEIEKVFDNADYQTFFFEEKYNFDITDKYLDDKVREWFSEKEYDNIFIPLCFGPTLSDYNGLRFALHIRCTQTMNQTKNIYLYSFVDFSYIIKNTYFDIIKTKNIELISYSKSAFQMAVLQKRDILMIDEIYKEIRKIKLNLPKNYDGNHSIANEWAIYRWAKLINSGNSDINKIIEKIDTDIYFKYLKTIYPIKNEDKIIEQDLEIKYTGNPNILLIDDESEKGWYELLYHILSDINGITEFSYIGNELNLLDQDDLVKKCINYVKENDIDLVILDFRIIEADHTELDVAKISGYRILDGIKIYNTGIQVVVLSATNKALNLLALQDAKADGFIVKERPENSMDEMFTYETITSFCKTMTKVIERKFLKDLYRKVKTVKRNLLLVDAIEENKNFNNLLNELNTQIKVIETSLDGIDVEKSTTIDIVFLAAFNFLELFNKYYIKQERDYRYYIGHDLIELKRYNVKGNKLDDKGPFIGNTIYDKPSWFHSISGILKDYFNIDIKQKNIYQNLWKIKELRNDYIHSKKPNFEVDELNLIMDILILSTRFMRE